MLGWQVATRSAAQLISGAARLMSQRFKRRVKLPRGPFIDSSGGQISLEEVPAIIFSEVLRDVDLFVAITSVANDPGWSDGGPAGRFGDYWATWAFGELGQSAAMRRDLIQSIIPSLSIADKLEVTAKSLHVRGRRNTYAIHFGSANVQILPQNRYLCIVPNRMPREARDIRLPFAGDNVVSIILAKAMLLVDESKIRDSTILSQM